MYTSRYIKHGVKNLTFIETFIYWNPTQDEYSEYDFLTCHISYE